MPDSHASLWQGRILPLYRPSQTVSLGDAPILGVGVCFDFAAPRTSPNFGIFPTLDDSLRGLNAVEVMVDVDCESTGCNPQPIIARPATPFRQLTNCHDAGGAVSCQDVAANFGVASDSLDRCMASTKGTMDLTAQLSVGGTPHDGHLDHILFTTTLGCGDDGTFSSLVHVLP